MKRILCLATLTLGVGVADTCPVEARGFGGFRGGGFSGGFSGGGFRSDSFGGYSRDVGGFSSSGYRSSSSYSGFRGGYGASSSYDRSFSDARGGSVNVSGDRGFASGPFGGTAAGGTRDVSATTAGGRTYSSSRTSAAAAGPYGRMFGGSEKSASASGYRGSVSGVSRTAFAGGRMPGDFGLSHYSAFGAAGVHSTAFWSHGYMTTRGAAVRTNFGYYNCFHAGWYTAHPGCWHPAAWGVAAAWRTTTWAALAAACSISAEPVDYNYGDSVVYQNDNVYVNGTDVGTARQYNQQATALADQGQKAAPPDNDTWTPMGVYGLVQGDEKTSNNIFQLAINSQGIIRGNYYDGLMDTTTPVYGSVNQKTQRAAWTIGKKNDRVFEAGIYNLTKEEAPVLVHLGSDRTQQWMLVRMQQPKSGTQGGMSE